MDLPLLSCLPVRADFAKHEPFNRIEFKALIVTPAKHVHCVSCYTATMTVARCIHLRVRFFGEPAVSLAIIDEHGAQSFRLIVHTTCQHNVAILDNARSEARKIIRVFKLR